MAAKISQSEAEEKTRSRLISDTTKAIEYVTKTRTLSDLLHDLQMADDGLLRLDTTNLVDDIKDKVDSYKYVDEKFDSEILRLTEQIDKLAEARTRLVTNKARLREWMAIQMKNNGYTKLPGQNYKVSLVTQQKVLLNLGSATEQSYEDYPDLVFPKYEWNKRAVEALVKNNPEANKEFGSIIEKSHVKFSLKGSADE